MKLNSRHVVLPLVRAAILAILPGALSAAGLTTPEFQLTSDTSVALQLADIGVVLLMFGVGLHFSLKDLLSVKAIAVPGAVAPAK